MRCCKIVGLVLKPSKGKIFLIFIPHAEASFCDMRASVVGVSNARKRSSARDRRDGGGDGDGDDAQLVDLGAARNHARIK